MTRDRLGRSLFCNCKLSADFCTFWSSIPLTTPLVSAHPGVPFLRSLLDDDLLLPALGARPAALLMLVLILRLVIREAPTGLLGVSFTPPPSHAGLGGRAAPERID